MTIRKKQRLFIEAYTDRTNPDTFEHGTNSAKKAGYSHNRAAAHASHLLNQKRIHDEVVRINEEYNQRFSGTLENKVRIAWEQYERALKEKNKSEMKFWWEQHCKLSGHYAENINFKDKTERTPEERKELTQIKNRIFDVKPLIPAG